VKKELDKAWAEFCHKTRHNYISNWITRFLFEQSVKVLLGGNVSIEWNDETGGCIVDHIYGFEL